MNTIEQYAKGILNNIEDAHQGLPEAVFEMISELTPMVNVDLFIRNNLGYILLIWRDDEYCGCGWHIPGGILRFQETREERLRITARKELHSEINFNKNPIAVNEIIMPQKIRGHFLSFLYQCQLPSNCPEFVVEGAVKAKPAPGEIRWHKSSPDQWVKGQKEIYASLFECTGMSKSTYFEENYRMDIILENVKKGNYTFTFDIDGVIASLDASLRYDLEQPLQKTITIINKLYEYGNKIILLTARGSQTGIDWSELTAAQMKKWGVNYHELKFGKPASSFYIDDKNMDLYNLYGLGEMLLK